MPFLTSNPILQRVVIKTQALIDNPTVEMLADYAALYTTGVEPLVRYHSNGTSLEIVTQSQATIDAMIGATADLGALAPAVQTLVDASAALKANVDAYDRSTHYGPDAPNLKEQLASYTLTADDTVPNTTIRMNVATENTVTVPAFASVAIPIGARIPIDQWGEGTTTIVAGTGVTIRSSSSLQVRSRYSRVWLEKQGTDEWLLTGDLSSGGQTGAPPLNTVPPTISGTAVSGNTLTRVAGTWTGTPTPTVTGQWYANGVAIGGQTAATYVTANPGDDGKAITYRESAVSTSGGPTTATSNSITMTPVAATKPVSNGIIPVITGNGTVGSVLTATTGGWTNSPTTHKWQWYHDGTTLLEDTGQIGGATDTYTVLSGSAGKTITVKVTASNASGDTDVPVTSAGFPISTTLSLTSATIQASAATINLVFNTATRVGTGGPDGLTISLSGGAATLDYYSGNGSNTLVYLISRSVGSGETGTISYTQPGNGLEASSNGADIASFGPTSITNSSAGLPTYTGTYTINAAAITANGSSTFVGLNLESTGDAPALAITVTTPITLLNCRIKGPSYQFLITQPFNSNVTFRNCAFKLTPRATSGQIPGWLCNPENVASFTMENCSVHKATSYLQGPRSGPITIRYNRVYDIDGRASNGAGGYLTPATGVDVPTFKQFVQMNGVTGSAQVDISWNYCLNVAGQSRPEDVISLYGTTGTSGAKVLVHHNLIDGCYGDAPLTQTAVSGGGILTDGGAGAQSAYCDVYNNWILNTENYGIAIVSGNNNAFHDNIVWSPSRITDGGARLAANNVGVIFNDYYAVGAAFFNNAITNNTIKWSDEFGSANPSYKPATGTNNNTWVGNTEAGECTWAEYRSKILEFKMAYIAAGHVIGASIQP